MFCNSLGINSHEQTAAIHAVLVGHCIPNVPTRVGWFEDQRRDPVEVSYDQKKQRRVARAKLISNAVTEFIFYSVEWHDAKKGVFSVQITEQP